MAGRSGKYQQFIPSQISQRSWLPSPTASSWRSGTTTTSDLAELGETVELTLALRTDLISKVAYNIFYSGYIHGQGYIRLAVAKADNPVAKTIIEDVYIPGLKAIYRPIISQFQGFRTRDFFGTMASSVGGQIYYSGITSRSDNKDVLVSDVVGRLYALDDLLKEPEIRHALAELDLQVSLLPSTVWD